MKRRDVEGFRVECIHTESEVEERLKSDYRCTRQKIDKRHSAVYKDGSQQIRRDEVIKDGWGLGGESK